MKIDKAPKQPAEFLDDHLGKSLTDSIAKLIGQTVKQRAEEKVLKSKNKVRRRY
eukprot:m.472529 g.472529  ORF g.472529 m.472529 type:complete len:54 (-) comp328963_c0_seq1:24-185(-)